MIDRARAGYLGIATTLGTATAVALGLYGRFVHPLPAWLPA